MPPLLLLQDITLTFGVAPLLSGAGLAVATSDRICLVGRNGSGKSSLLRIAAGLVQADAGERFAQPVHQLRDLVLLSDTAGAADQSVRVCGHGNDDASRGHAARCAYRAVI